MTQTHQSHTINQSEQQQFECSHFPTELTLHILVYLSPETLFHVLIGSEWKCWPNNWHIASGSNHYPTTTATHFRNNKIPRINLIKLAPYSKQTDEMITQFWRRDIMQRIVWEGKFSSHVSHREDTTTSKPSLEAFWRAFLYTVLCYMDNLNDISRFYKKQMEQFSSSSGMHPSMSMIFGDLGQYFKMEHGMDFSLSSGANNTPPGDLKHLAHCFVTRAHPSYSPYREELIRYWIPKIVGRDMFFFWSRYAFPLLFAEMKHNARLDVEPSSLFDEFRYSPYDPLQDSSEAARRFYRIKFVTLTCSLRRCERKVERNSFLLYFCYVDRNHTELAITAEVKEDELHSIFSSNHSQGHASSIDSHLFPFTKYSPVEIYGHLEIHYKVPFNSIAGVFKLLTMSFIHEANNQVAVDLVDSQQEGTFVWQEEGRLQIVSPNDDSISTSGFSGEPAIRPDSEKQALTKFSSPSSLHNRQPHPPMFDVRTPHYVYSPHQFISFGHLLFKCHNHISVLRHLYSPSPPKSLDQLFQGSIVRLHGVVAEVNDQYVRIVVRVPSKSVISRISKSFHVDTDRCVLYGYSVLLVSEMDVPRWLILKTGDVVEVLAQVGGNRKVSLLRRFYKVSLVKPAPLLSYSYRNLAFIALYGYLAFVSGRSLWNRRRGLFTVEPPTIVRSSQRNAQAWFQVAAAFVLQPPIYFFALQLATLNLFVNSLDTFWILLQNWSPVVPYTICSSVVCVHMYRLCKKVKTWFRQKRMLHYSTSRTSS